MFKVYPERSTPTTKNGLSPRDFVDRCAARRLHPPHCRDNYAYHNFRIRQRGGVLSRFSHLCYLTGYAAVVFLCTAVRRVVPDTCGMGNIPRNLHLLQPDNVLAQISDQGSRFCRQTLETWHVATYARILVLRSCSNRLCRVLMIGPSSSVHRR